MFTLFKNLGVTQDAFTDSTQMDLILKTYHCVCVVIGVVFGGHSGYRFAAGIWGEL